MKFKEHREAYSYPFVALTGTIGQHSCVEFNTSSKLDAYHHQLLRSPQDEQSVLGYLSVLYWGALRNLQRHRKPQSCFIQSSDSHQRFELYPQGCKHQTTRHC